MSTMYVDNLREKTLDSGVHIPGHVVQFKYNILTQSSGSTTSTSMVDISPYYIDITPKNANNIIVFETNFHAAVTGTNSYARFRVIDSLNSNTQWSSGTYIGAFGYKVIDSWDEVIIRTANPAGTTNAMRLQLQGFVTADSLEWAWSGGDRRLISAMEIAV
tara:strand:- start:331 stop:813 length:483 start_codon:yes stop_codon:yes gene_type:complete